MEGTDENGQMYKEEKDDMGDNKFSFDIPRCARSYEQNCSFRKKSYLLEIKLNHH